MLMSWWRAVRCRFSGLAGIFCISCGSGCASSNPACISPVKDVAMPTRKSLRDCGQPEVMSCPVQRMARFSSSSPAVFEPGCIGPIQNATNPSPFFVQKNLKPRRVLGLIIAFDKPASEKVVGRGRHFTDFARHPGDGIPHGRHFQFRHSLHALEAERRARQTSYR